MRDINFRAWDKKKKEMYFVYNLIFRQSDGQITVLPKRYPLDYKYRYFPNDIELMQYTGLKDKHGKEIYEGDIVKLLINHLSDFDPNTQNTDIVPVKFDNAMFYFGDMTMNYKPLIDAMFEVIGNIYENPELLK